MESKETIEKTLKNILNFLIEEEITIFSSVDELTNSLRFSIETADPKDIIGQKGATLSAIQHIAKKISDKKAGTEEGLIFVFDVNDYNKKRTDILRSKINIFAERAHLFKNDITLEPMSSYERLIVHTILAGDKNLRTESQGDGKERHIVIRYIETE